MTTTVAFTQFLRPDGRPVPRVVTCSEELARLALRVVEAGGRFESEVLTSGDVSLTVERGDGDDGPVASEVCPNGPAVAEALARLIRAAAAQLGVAA